MIFNLKIENYFPSRIEKFFKKKAHAKINPYCEFIFQRLYAYGLCGAKETEPLIPQLICVIHIKSRQRPRPKMIFSHLSP